MSAPTTLADRIAAKLAELYNHPGTTAADWTPEAAAIADLVDADRVTQLGALVAERDQAVSERDTLWLQVRVDLARALGDTEMPTPTWPTLLTHAAGWKTTATAEAELLVLGAWLVAEARWHLSVALDALHLRHGGPDAPTDLATGILGERRGECARGAT